MKNLRRPGKRLSYLLVVIVLLGAYGTWALRKPLPMLQPIPATRQLSVSAGSSKLSWPAAGQSAVGILDSRIFEVHGAQKPAPIASVAKVITALTVLDKKPVAPGGPGPVITLSADDVALFRNYAAQDGSLVPVTAGEQISEYQILQAMMLPSANNIADSLAIWAFGSLPAYTAAANTYLAAHGLGDTHVGADASGLSATTVSTAGDLVKLGNLAMQNKALAQIVGQATADGIPMTTTVKNVNFLLGTSNIIGIKTGNTEQAGGVFLSASQITINNKPVTIVTAVVGSPTLFVAMKDSLTLVRSAQANFQPVTIAKAGDILTRYNLPWGGLVAAVVDKDLKTSAWKGSTVAAAAKLKPIKATSTKNEIVSILTISDSAGNANKVAVKLATAPTAPSAWWRLIHPF
jgi:D-alanyl-D-alanine carboxypeptidase (penicillin-binding protein 5/6)